MCACGVNKYTKTVASALLKNMCRCELLNSSDASNDEDENKEDEFLSQITTDLVNDDLAIIAAVSGQLVDI